MAQNNAINNRSSTLTVDNTLTVTAGDATVSAGNVKLPTTTSTTGQLQINATRFVHGYGSADNVFVGQQAGNFTLSGTQNSCIGYQSGDAITSASGVTALGYIAASGVTTGTGNSALGYSALTGVSTGTYNTGIGMQALTQAATSASYNTALGYQAGVNYTGTESSNVLIMNTGTVGESNKMRLGTDGTGNGQVDTAVIAGTNVSISTAASAGTVNIATGAGAKVVILGSTNGASSLALKYGTADFSIASATGTVMNILDTGEMTMPLQSAFSAAIVADSNVTGDGTNFQIGSGNALSEFFDQNNDFNTNGTFTAPVTGRYLLGISLLVQSLAAANNVNLSITTSNHNFLIVNMASAFIGNNNYAATVFCDMDAGDTYTSNISVAGGAKVIDTYGSAGDPRSVMWGYLVC